MKKRLLPIFLLASTMMLGGCKSTISGLMNGANSSDSSSESNSQGGSGTSNTGGTHTTGGTSGHAEFTLEEPVYEGEVFTLAGKGQGWSSASGTAITSPRAEADYTILIYLCGSNLESYDEEYDQYGSQASTNILEMLEVGIPSNVNVVIETGGAASKTASSNGGYPYYANSTSRWGQNSVTYSGWNNELLGSYQEGLSIKDNALERWHIENHRLVRDGQASSYASMGAQSTFFDFVSYGTTRFPAKKTGVIMWDHGGAMMGCCQDEIKDDILTPFEMDAALTSVLGSTKLEWIGYDCCLMEVADIASLNSKHFNYMVVAQESEPGGGWDYNGWLDDVVADTNIATSTLLSEIADTFVEKCAADYNAYGNYCVELGNHYIAYGQYLNSIGETDEDGNSGSTYIHCGNQFVSEGRKYIGLNDATLSVLDLSKMSAFDSAWNALGTTMSSKITSSRNWSTFKTNVLNNSLTFGEGGYDVFNIKDVLTNINSNYSVDVSAVTSALDNLVVHNTYGVSYTSSDGLPCGLCAYIACNYSPSYFDITESNAVFSSWYDIYSEYVTGGQGGWGGYGY